MKAPNGYGSVCHLSGRRRRPWAVRMTVGYNENGSPKVEYIGYYETKAAAFAARDAYHTQQAPAAENMPTFAEIADQFKAEHYSEIAPRTQQVYDTAFRKCADIACKPIDEISYTDLQELVNASTASAQNTLRTFLKQCFDFALVRDYIDKNPAAHLKVAKREKSTLHYRYTAEEVQKLWTIADTPAGAFVLLSIYTGMRPSELMHAELKDNCFVIHAGKTKNAARIVPVHPDCTPLLQYVPFVFRDVDRNTFINTYFAPALISAGCYEYTHPETGQVQHHMPHDGRHTFTSRWKELRLDDSIRAYLQGHTQKDIGGRVYTHYDVDIIRAELSRLVY